MKHSIFAWLIVLAGLGVCLTNPVAAQVGGVLQSPPTGPAIDPNKARVVEVTLHLPDAAPPSAPFSFEFSPNERMPGNAALIYLQALTFMRQLPPEESEEISTLRDLPLAELNVERAGALVKSQLDDAFQYFELASRRESCDWGTPIRELGAATLMPELGRFRQFARTIALKARVEMAQGKLDEALNTIRVGVSLARHLAEGPTIIQSLVGAAILSLMHYQIDVLVSLPGAPSLYWALTDLGTPVLSFDRSIATEKHFLESELKELLAIHSGEMAPDAAVAAWRAFAMRFDHSLPRDRPPSSDELFRWSAKSAVEMSTAYPAAREYLLTRNYTGAQIDAMPVTYVSIRHLLAEYLVWREELFKWTNIPYWQATPGFERAWRSLESSAVLNRSQVLADFIPPIAHNMTSWAGCERRTALLRCVEAVRLYAASNEGKLPASLDDTASIAPCPMDPVTGRAFDYRVEGDSALISGETPPRQEPVMGTQYRVRIAPRAKP